MLDTVGCVEMAAGDSSLDGEVEFSKSTGETSVVFPRCASSRGFFR